MPKIKFVSYSGKYPNLCSGVLKFKVDGKLYAIGKNEYFWLESGGRVSFDDNWNAEVAHGPWSIPEKYLPDELRPYHKQIEDMINQNIPEGCCGGCI